jgi:predicted anti-sigma-YlaC factor YlaD
MTMSARCKDVERLALEGEDRALTAEEGRVVEGHLRECGRCRSFASDRALIRDGLASVRWPAPSDEIVRRTRRLVRESGQERAPAAVPAWVLVALAAATVITGLWLAISLADVTPDMTLSDLPAEGMAAVFVIVQNALMLFFAPVVLRTFRARRGVATSAR